MSIYTYTNEEFQQIHKKLCETFNTEIPYVDFGITIIESVPRNSAPVSLPGELNPFYGKTHSAEFIERQKSRRTNKTYDEIFGEKSQEIRHKQSIAHMGKSIKHTDASKDKIRLVCQNRDQDYYNRIGKILANRPKLTCPHCGKEVDERNAKRWHYENCKLANK